jgi:hypothetical protein
VTKSRPKSRKAARKPSRTKSTRKAVRRKAPAARAGAAARVLSLRRLRADLDLAVRSLSRRVESRGEPSAKLSEAQTVLTRWASEIDNLCDPDMQELCGPTMDIPLA